MAQTLLLDSLSWDLVLTAQGDIAVASEPYALAQDAASECKLFAGEAFYDTGRGIPYWGQILGLRPPLSLVRAYLIQAALIGVPETSLRRRCFSLVLLRQKADRTSSGLQKWRPAVIIA